MDGHSDHAFEGQGEDSPRISKGFRGFSSEEQLRQESPEATFLHLVGNSSPTD
jgi:hypothetical protein